MDCGKCGRMLCDSVDEGLVHGKTPFLSGEVKEDFFQRLIIITELKHTTSSNSLKAPQGDLGPDFKERSQEQVYLMLFTAIPSLPRDFDCKAGILSQG